MNKDNIKIMTPYKVMKNNTDNTLKKGDIIWFSEDNTKDKYHISLNKKQA